MIEGHAGTTWGRIRIFAALLLAALFPAWPDADAAEKPSMVERMAPLAADGTVVLLNDEDQAISFHLSRCQTPGKAWTLQSGAAEEFPCRNGCDICVFTSRDVKVNYALSERARYRLYWNEAQARWDVARIGSSDGE